MICKLGRRSFRPEHPAFCIKPGIYYRDIHNTIYRLPNTWETGALIEFVVQVQGFVLSGMQSARENLPRQQLYRLDGAIAEVELMALNDWWEQRFVGEDSESAPLPPPRPNAPGAGRLQCFPVGDH